MLYAGYVNLETVDVATGTALSYQGGCDGGDANGFGFAPGLTDCRP